MDELLEKTIHHQICENDNLNLADCQPLIDDTKVISKKEKKYDFFPIHIY